MAELIPLEYRIQVAQRGLIRKWGAVLALTGIIAAGSFAYVYNWQRTQLNEYNRLNQSFSVRLIKKVEAKDLISRRAQLAQRMSIVQGLKNDELLLSLLRNVSSEFSDNDMLESLDMLVHGPVGSDKSSNRYYARINGETVNDATRADLVDRLTKAGKQSSPLMAVSAESTSIVQILDGEGVKFQITCDQPVVRLTEASESSDRGK